MRMEKYYPNKNIGFEQFIKTFNFNDATLENGLLEKQEEMYNLHKEYFFVLDRLPKTIDSFEWFEPFDIFYRINQLPEEKEKFYKLENAFLKCLTIIAAYSSVWLESSLFYNQPSYGIEFLSKEEVNYLLKVKDNQLIKIADPFQLRCFLKLSLRDFEQTVIYLPDMKVILWVKDLFVVIYSPDNESTQLIKTVCLTEGLYFRAANNLF